MGRCLRVMMLAAGTRDWASADACRASVHRATPAHDSRASPDWCPRWRSVCTGIRREQIIFRADDGDLFRHRQPGPSPRHPKPSNACHHCRENGERFGQLLAARVSHCACDSIDPCRSRYSGARYHGSRAHSAIRPLERSTNPPARAWRTTSYPNRRSRQRLKPRERNVPPPCWPHGSDPPKTRGNF